jgi:CRISPR/Cas system CMR-associated protein Cmr5 small subunit
MKNLEQIRAKNALEAASKCKFTGKDDGKVVKKVPTMIMNNGLLAAAAFAAETPKGYKDVFNAIIVHLESTNNLPGKEKQLQGFINDLCETDSSELRQITSETIAYLNYLRRFAK